MAHRNRGGVDGGRTIAAVASRNPLVAAHVTSQAVGKPFRRGLVTPADENFTFGRASDRGSDSVADLLGMTPPPPRESNPSRQSRGGPYISPSADPDFEGGDDATGEGVGPSGGKGAKGRAVPRRAAGGGVGVVPGAMAGRGKHETDYCKLNKMMASKAPRPGSKGARTSKSAHATRDALAAKITVKHGKERHAHRSVDAHRADAVFTPDPTKFGIKTVHGDKVGDVMAAPGDDWDGIAHQVETSMSALNVSMESHHSRGSGSRGGSRGGVGGASRHGLEGPSILRRPATTKSQEVRMASTQKKLHPKSDLPGHKLKQFSPERVKSKVFEPSLRQREAMMALEQQERQQQRRSGMSRGSSSVNHESRHGSAGRNHHHHNNNNNNAAASPSSWHFVSPSETQTPHGLNANGNNNNGHIPIDDAPWSPEPLHRYRPPHEMREEVGPPTGRSDAPSFAGFSEISHETLREEDFEKGGGAGKGTGGGLASERSRAPDAPGHTGRGQRVNNSSSDKRRPGSSTVDSRRSSGGGMLDTTVDTVVPEIRLNDPHMVSHRKREARPARR